MGSAMRGAALWLLPLLSVAGVYCLWVVAGKNGLFKQIGDIAEAKYPMFPGTESPLVREYTGVAAIDRQLTTLVVFFGPVVQGGDEALNLFSVFGLGQFGGAWALLLMESLRRGNKGKAVSFVGTYGFFVQNVSYAISTPLYLFIHLLTSPISEPFTATNPGSVLLVSSYDLAIIPISIILGYIIPSLLTVFPAGSAIGSPTHQYLVAFWQAFPLWTLLVQWTFKLSCTLFLGPDAVTKTEKSPQTIVTNTYLKYAGYLYTFVLVLCIATQQASVTISLLPPDINLESLPALAYLIHASFTSTFVPPVPLGQPIKALAEGAHIFLLWDMYIGSIAGILWAVVLCQNVSLGKQNLASNASIVAKIIAWTVLGGPVAAWAILMWERDEAVLQKVKA